MIKTLEKTIYFSLQLFAVQVTTQDSLSAEMKTYYDMNLINEASPNLVHHQFGQKRDIPKGGGKTIEFRRFAPLNKALVPLTEGVTPAGNSLTVTNVEATVSQYGDFITQSDVLELTALDNTILEATKLLGKQAGLTLDTVVRNVMQSGTNVSYASKWSGTTEIPVTKRSDLDETAVLKVDTVNRVVAKLRSVNAPTFEDGYYVAIINPLAAYDIMNDKAWVESHQYATPENLYKGEIGRIGGVRFVESSEAKIYDGAHIPLGKDVAGNDVYTLSVNGSYTGAIETLNFDGATVVADDLIGKFIEINGVIAKVTDNTTTSISFASTNFGDIADNTVIKAAECAAGAVFATLFIADGAYGTTEITGGGLETIIKQRGSAGTSDPLDQRSSVGWKALKTATILIPDYLVRVEHCSPVFSKTATEN